MLTFELYLNIYININSFKAHKFSSILYIPVLAQNNYKVKVKYIYYADFDKVDTELPAPF